MIIIKILVQLCWSKPDKHICTLCAVMSEYMKNMAMFLIGCFQPCTTVPLQCGGFRIGMYLKHDPLHQRLRNCTSLIEIKSLITSTHSTRYYLQSSFRQSSNMKHDGIPNRCRKRKQWAIFWTSPPEEWSVQWIEEIEIKIKGTLLWYHPVDFTSNLENQFSCPRFSSSFYPRTTDLTHMALPEAKHQRCLGMRQVSQTSESVLYIWACVHEERLKLNMDNL